MLPHRPPRAAPRRAEAQGSALRGTLFATFFAQPRIGVVLAFILLYNAGDQLMFNMSAPFLKSLGLGTELRGRVGTLGTLASISGSIHGRERRHRAVWASGA